MEVTVTQTACRLHRGRGTLVHEATVPTNLFDVYMNGIRETEAGHRAEVVHYEGAVRTATDRDGKRNAACAEKSKKSNFSIMY